jgi:hypothetical protein
VSTENSAARAVTETLNTESTTIGDKSAAPGTVRRVTETPTEAGNVRTVDRVETPTDQTSVSTEDSAEVEVEETLHTEGKTILDKSAAAGTVRRVTETPTEAGNVRTVDRVEERKDNGVKGVCVVRTPRMTSTIDVIDGAATPPAALTDGQFGLISVRKDRYGTYVGEKRVNVYNTDVTLPDWTIGSAGTQTLKSYRRRQTAAGKWYYKEITWTVAFNQRSSHSAANADVADGLIDGPSGGSRVVALSNGRYLSIKVTNNEYTTATWELETFP